MKLRSTVLLVLFFYYRAFAMPFSDSQLEQVVEWLKGDSSIEFCQQAVGTLNRLNAEEGLPIQEKIHVFSILGVAYSKLAEFEVDPSGNFQRSIKNYLDALKLDESWRNYSQMTIKQFRMILNMGRSYHKLAKLGVNSKQNFEESIKIYNQSLNYIKFSKNAALYRNYYFNILVGQAGAYFQLADSGILPYLNYSASCEKYTLALAWNDGQKMNAFSDFNRAKIYYYRGRAYFKLAGLGVENEIYDRRSLEDYIEALQVKGQDGLSILGEEIETELFEDIKSIHDWKLLVF